MLLALYLIIFNFSAQTGEESGSVSREISIICVELMETISGKDWSQDFTEELAAYFEHPIRKLAHFSEYAVMGILVRYILAQWVQKKGKVRWLGVLWIFLSAALDEFHQLFVPDRYGSLADVFLDTLGGVFGILLCSLVIRRILNQKSKIPGP